MEFRWPWPSQKLTRRQEGAHPFIHRTGIVDVHSTPGPVLRVAETRRQSCVTAPVGTLLSCRSETHPRHRGLPAVRLWAPNPPGTCLLIRKIRFLQLPITCTFSPPIICFLQRIFWGVYLLIRLQFILIRWGEELSWCLSWGFRLFRLRIVKQVHNPTSPKPRGQMCFVS